jgi:hypothetical protein
VDVSGGAGGGGGSGGPGGHPEMVPQISRKGRVVGWAYAGPSGTSGSPGRRGPRGDAGRFTIQRADVSSKFHGLGALVAL